MNCWQRKPMPEPKGRHGLGGSTEGLTGHWWSRDREVVGGIPAPGEISRTPHSLLWTYCSGVTVYLSCYGLTVVDSLSIYPLEETNTDVSWTIGVCTLSIP